MNRYSEIFAITKDQSYRNFRLLNKKLNNLETADITALTIIRLDTF